MSSLKLKDIDLLKVGHTIQMMGVVYAGEGVLYVVPFPDEAGGYFDDTFDNYRFNPKGVDRDEPGTLECATLDMDQDDWAVFLRQTDLLETEVLSKVGGNKEIAKAVVRKSQRQISQGVSWAVYKRDGYKCRYCAADDVPLTVDHLVLWEEGGPSIKENLVSACRRCNKTRGNTQYSDWLEHNHYKAASRKLDPATRQANRDLVPTLGAIPRTVHQPSHR
jgi:HNH endonuclease